jgi:glutamate dehydrogenase
MELTRHGLGIHLVVHPIIGVCRDPDGKLTDLRDDADPEAFMHFEVDRETDAALLEALRRDLLRVLGDVRAAVDDWEAMRDKAIVIAGSLTDPADAEAAALLRWMADDHFTFLGYRDAETGASLGVSRVADGAPSGGVRAGLTVRKADTRATVHRPVHMDQVCIGPHELLGLWARTAYNTTPLDIPLLRRKVDAVIDRSGLPRDSHSGKDLGSILDTSFEIAVRPGLHCAPYIHRALGTFPDGTLRLSPGPFSTPEQIDTFLHALDEITAGVL